MITLQGTNISHLRKRKIIFKYALSGGQVNFLEGISYNPILGMGFRPSIINPTLGRGLESGFFGKFFSKH